MTFLQYLESVLLNENHQNGVFLTTTHDFSGYFMILDDLDDKSIELLTSIHDLRNYIYLISKWDTNIHEKDNLHLLNLIIEIERLIWMINIL
jgi:hypothetical protein